jgi:hypothetical protein
MSRKYDTQSSGSEREARSFRSNGSAFDGEERRIRWQRDPHGSDRIIVVDAVTGAVISVVRSLFDLCRRPR